MRKEDEQYECDDMKKRNHLPPNLQPGGPGGVIGESSPTTTKQNIYRAGVGDGYLNISPARATTGQGGGGSCINLTTNYRTGGGGNNNGGAIMMDELVLLNSAGQYMQSSHTTLSPFMNFYNVSNCGPEIHHQPLLHQENFCADTSRMHVSHSCPHFYGALPPDPVLPRVQCGGMYPPAVVPTVSDSVHFEMGMSPIHRLSFQHGGPMATSSPVRVGVTASGNGRPHVSGVRPQTGHYCPVHNSPHHSVASRCSLTCCTHKHNTSFSAENGQGTSVCTSSPRYYNPNRSQDSICSGSCIESTTSSGECLPPIGVFWDIENCHVPNGKSALALVKVIRDNFFTGYREAEFMCVCDINKESKEVIQELNDSQVTVAHINATAKNAADDKLRQSLRRFADTHTPPAAIVLISGDVNFASELSDLRHRNQIHVILVHPNHTQKALLTTANQTHSFNDLVLNLPERPITYRSSDSVELLVTKFPQTKDAGQIRQRLKLLSTNCGGKVTLVTRTSAIIRFSSFDSAMRAQKRLDGEDVFGCKVEVSLGKKMSRHRVNSDTSSTNNGESKQQMTQSPESDSISKISDQRKSTTDEDKYDDSDKLCSNSPCGSTKTSLASQSQATEPVTSTCLDTGFALGPASVSDSIQEDIEVAQLTSQAQAGQDYRPVSPTNRHFNAIPQQWRSHSAQAQPIYHRDSLSNSLYRRSASAGSVPYNKQITQHPVDVLVTNLDECMTECQLQSQLSYLFNEHCQVLDVSVNHRGRYGLQALVKVPHLYEAQSAIRELRCSRIGDRIVHISLAPQWNLNYVRSEIMSILNDVAGAALPLSKLNVLYENRFGKRLLLTDLYRIPDTVTVEEHCRNKVIRLVGAQPSCLPRLTKQPWCIEADTSLDDREVAVPAQCPIHWSRSVAYPEYSPCEPIINIRLKIFSSQVHTLLLNHAGSMPLLTFPVCYAAQFEQLNMVSDNNGVPLEHVIMCVPGVEIVSRSRVKLVCWAKDMPNSGTTGETVYRSPSPLLSPELLQFSREVTELLKTMPRCRMSLEKFIPAYHHHFGRQCRLSDYGACRLMELFTAIKHVVQVLGYGAINTLSLTHWSQVRRFTSDVLRILKNQTSKELQLSLLSEIFSCVLGRQFCIYDYGVCHIDDLLCEVPDNMFTVNKLGDSSDKVIRLPRRGEQTPAERARMAQFAREVFDMLKRCPGGKMPFSRFIPIYHHRYGRQCRLSDYGFDKLIDLFESISDTVQIEERCEEKTLMLTEPYQLQMFSRQLVYLLKQHENQQLGVKQFLHKYAEQYGYPLKLQDFSCCHIEELLARLPHVVQVRGCIDEKFIALVNRSHLHQLSQSVLILLFDQTDGKINIELFDSIYRHAYGYSCHPTEYGFSKLQDLLRALYKIVKLKQESDILSVCLTELYMLGRDVRILLRSCGGCVPLQLFSTAYQQQFATLCVPLEYGFPTVSSLLAALSQVVTVSGRGIDRMVTLRPDMMSGVDIMDAGIPSHVPSPDIKPEQQEPPFREDLMKFSQDFQNDEIDGERASVVSGSNGLMTRAAQLLDTIPSSSDHIQSENTNPTQIYNKPDTDIPMMHQTSAYPSNDGMVQYPYMVPSGPYPPPSITHPPFLYGLPMPQYALPMLANHYSEGLPRRPNSCPPYPSSNTPIFYPNFIPFPQANPVISAQCPQPVFPALSFVNVFSGSTVPLFQNPAPLPLNPAPLPLTPFAPIPIPTNTPEVEERKSGGTTSIDRPGISPESLSKLNTSLLTTMGIGAGHESPTVHSCSTLLSMIRKKPVTDPASSSTCPCLSLVSELRHMQCNMSPGSSVSHSPLDEDSAIVKVGSISPIDSSADKYNRSSDDHQRSSSTTNQSSSSPIISIFSVANSSSGIGIENSRMSYIDSSDSCKKDPITSVSNGGIATTPSTSFSDSSQNSSRSSSKNCAKSKPRIAAQFPTPSK